MAALIEVNRLTKTYGWNWGQRSSAALRDVSFSVGEGDILALLGPNGSGKSTTLKLLLGLLRATSGTCRLRGRDPAQPAARRGVGVVAETPSLPGHFTGRAWLRWQARLAGAAPGARCSEVEAAIEEQTLGAAADLPIRHYSKGMRQKLCLASASLGAPSILLLDEPSSGLDPEVTLALRPWLQTRRAQGAAIVLATHDLGLVRHLADKVLVLRQGRAVFQGTMASFLSSATEETVEAAYLNAIRSSGPPGGAEIPL